MFCLNRPAMPMVRPRTAFSLAPIMPPRSISTPPGAVESVRTWSAVWGGERTLDAVLAEVILGIVVEVRGVEERLRGDAADVEASATERGALLNAGGLKTELASLDGGNVTAGARANHHDILLL